MTLPGRLDFLHYPNEEDPDDASRRAVPGQFFVYVKATVRFYVKNGKENSEMFSGGKKIYNVLNCKNNLHNAKREICPCCSVNILN